VSPLSGESYDDTRSGSGRVRYDGSDGYGAKLAESDPYERDYDEVVTTLWLPMRDLGVGDVGTDVGMLQQAFGLPASGVFDKSTAREIARWQQDLGLPKTGYFGVASREAFARAAADARNAERERMGARRARGAPGRGQPYVGTSAASPYGPQDRPSLDALAPVTTARSGRETYGRAVRVPSDHTPVPSSRGDGVGVGAIAFVAAAAAAAGAAAARRGGVAPFGPRKKPFAPESGSSRDARVFRTGANGATRGDSRSNVRTSPFDGDGRGFGAPTVPVQSAFAPKGGKSASLPVRRFTSRRAPRRRRRRRAPEVSPTRKNTDWNARESWAGKPPPYEELVGFKPKPKEEVVPTDATKNKNAGDVADVASSSERFQRRRVLVRFEPVPARFDGGEDERARARRRSSRSAKTKRPAVSAASWRKRWGSTGGKTCRRWRRRSPNLRAAEKKRRERRQRWNPKREATTTTPSASRPRRFPSREEGA
jgi:hypothetical protein